VEEIIRLSTDRIRLLVELRLVLKLVLLRQEEPVEAVERKFEVIMYGTKEQEVLYDPKGQ
jgi:hypothetical protein